MTVIVTLKQPSNDPLWNKLNVKRFNDVQEICTIGLFDEFQMVWRDKKETILLSNIANIQVVP